MRYQLVGRRPHHVTVLLRRLGDSVTVVEHDEDAGTAIIDSDEPPPRFPPVDVTEIPADPVPLDA